MVGVLYRLKLISGLILGFYLFSTSASQAKNYVFTWPLSEGQTESQDYKVEVDGNPAFVATTAVLNGPPASYSSFDFSGSVEVVIETTQPIQSFKILPEALGIQGTSLNNHLVFTVSKPSNLTIEINGVSERALHLFANPPEATRPNLSDPNTTYFGPGLHEISTLHPKTGETLYLAAGAVLRAIIPPDEEPVEVVTRNGVEEKIYAPVIECGGVNRVNIVGRGILDLSALPFHSRKGIWFGQSSHILLEGITILDAPDWTVTFQECTQVKVENIKEISARENSDGIDICNSQNVLVENCFVRSNDDCIALKTITAQSTVSCRYITVQKNVLWNERARALGITSETLLSIQNVLFKDCDIIHDYSQDDDCSALAVLVADSGTMRCIVFQNIRVEDCRTTLLRCWIGHDGWSQDQKFGKIQGIVFANVTAKGPGTPASELIGFNPIHLVNYVTFMQLQINGKEIKSVTEANLKTNSYVKNIRGLSRR